MSAPFTCNVSGPTAVGILYPQSKRPTPVFRPRQVRADVRGSISPDVDSTPRLSITMEEARYLFIHPQLPASAPVGCPHIIDVESLDQDSPSSQPGLGIPDMVVTVLFNHGPKTLARFLDLSHDFKFRVHNKQEQARPEFCIIRKNTTVSVSDPPIKLSFEAKAAECGYLNESTTRRKQPWDIEYVYRMDYGLTGKWEPVIWKGWPGPREIKGEDILEISGIFAKDFLALQVWEEREDFEMLVEDSCDI